MPAITEALNADGFADTQIHDALAAGVDTLGQQQTVDFVPYVRTVLPLDGFVFWLNASLLSPAQLAQHGLQSAAPVTVEGSLHYASVGHQVEDETIAVRRVDFTAEEQITAFAEIAPDVMYVAGWTTPLGAFRFTFSQRSTFYQQAKLYHYVGDAVYPVFEAQLIDSLDAFDTRQVVSNSLPLWLALAQDPPPFLDITSALPLYPAYHVPPNLQPPYAAVEVQRSSTRALAAQALRQPDSSRAQIVQERVRVVLYGLRNDEASDWLDYVVDYSTLVATFGITNMPVLLDDYRPQIELAALAQKKMIEFEITYLQSRARNIARQLIENAFLSNIVGSDAPFPKPGQPLFILGQSVLGGTDVLA